MVVPSESHVLQICDASVIAMGSQMDSESVPSNAPVPVTMRSGRV